MGRKAYESSEEIYDEACTFTDEIDTYQKDKFIKGTKALFVASESNVQLVGDVDILEGGKMLQFRFQESLACRPQCCDACIRNLHAACMLRMHSISSLRGSTSRSYIPRHAAEFARSGLVQLLHRCGRASIQALGDFVRDLHLDTGRGRINCTKPSKAHGLLRSTNHQYKQHSALQSVDSAVRWLTGRNGSRPYASSSGCPR